MMYLMLFLRFCYIGLLAFGGGYAVIPLIQQQCVVETSYLTMTEFSDLLTISQITPGPIAINSASFVGMKVGGVFGSMVASLGIMLPPFIIASILYFIFKKYGDLQFMKDILSGLKPGVAALITVAAFDVFVEAIFNSDVIVLANADIFTLVLSLVAFVVVRKTKLGGILTILSCGLVGILREIIW